MIDTFNLNEVNQIDRLSIKFFRVHKKQEDGRQIQRGAYHLRLYFNFYRGSFG